MTAEQHEEYLGLVGITGTEEAMAKPKQEADRIIRTTIRLPQSLLNAAKHRGIDEGSSFQDVVIAALEQYLGKKGGR